MDQFTGPGGSPVERFQPVVMISRATGEAIESMPIQPEYAESGATAVTGTFTATGQSASFTPVPGRAFNPSLWGTFVATMALERSFNEGSTWLPVSQYGAAITFTGPMSESALETEVGVIYRWNCTAYTSGTVNYRLSA